MSEISDLDVILRGILYQAMTSDSIESFLCFMKAICSEETVAVVEGIVANGKERREKTAVS